MSFLMTIYVAYNRKYAVSRDTYIMMYDIWWLPSMTSTYILLKIHPHFPKNKRRYIIYSQLSSISRAIIQKNWSSGNWWIKGNRPRLNQSVDRLTIFKWLSVNLCEEFRLKIEVLMPITEYCFRVRTCAAWSGRRRARKTRDLARRTAGWLSAISLSPASSACDTVYTHCQE